MAGPFLIGVDVGTTSVKTALFDAGGALCAQSSSMIETARPAQAFVEQAPEDWISATLSGLAKVLHGVSLDAVAGIGLCSQVNTHVFVDANGQALAPAIVWQDGRCAQEAAKLDRLVSEEARLKWWGAPLPIDASHVLSRIGWMTRAHSDIWRRTRWVMAPKDYCLLQLTGEACADPLSAFGVVRFLPSLCRRTHRSRSGRGRAAAAFARPDRNDWTSSCRTAGRRTPSRCRDYGRLGRHGRRRRCQRRRRWLSERNKRSRRNCFAATSTHAGSDCVSQL